MTDHFNAIDYAHQLESAGVPAPQAEVHAAALAQVLDNCLSAATDTRSLKSGLLYKMSEMEVKLRAEIREVETTLRAQIREVETTLRAEIREVETTLRAEISKVETKLRGEIKELRAELMDRIDKLETRMNWMIGLVVATQLTLFAMVAGLYLR